MVSRLGDDTAALGHLRSLQDVFLSAPTKGNEHGLWATTSIPLPYGKGVDLGL
jgi:hypothetical protein